MQQHAEQSPSAFEFVGTWREYAPIALTNLALTIVTLGFYRFWAKARERRYLWSRTRFIDDRLEWTGTGREMFFGFLMVSAVVTLPLFLLFFTVQSMIMRGHGLGAGLLYVVIYIFLLYVAGFARFRALRYRLARSWWHGIRGGANDAGWSYAVAALWKPVVGFAAFGMLIPWSMVSLWNQRWNAMGFGPDSFRSHARVSNSLIVRWAILLFSPIALMIAIGIVVALVAVAAGGAGAFQGMDKGKAAAGIAIVMVLVLFAIYFLMGLIGLGYYAAFLRETIGALRLGELRFAFGARSRQWFGLFLGDIALVVGTLGIGICFLGYRHWRFFIRHLEATGELDVTRFTQSTAHAPREAEGFADAFDIGAL